MAPVSARSIALALPLALGLACAHGRSSQAQTDTTGEDRGTAAADMSGTSQDRLRGHSDDQTVTGRVTDVTAHSISIESGEGAAKTLHIVPQTVVTIDGRDARPDEIQQGQEVRASYNTQEGRDVAVRIVSEGSGGTGTSTDAPSYTPSEPSSDVPSDPYGRKPTDKG